MKKGNEEREGDEGGGQRTELWRSKTESSCRLVMEGSMLRTLIQCSGWERMSPEAATSDCW